MKLALISGLILLTSGAANAGSFPEARLDAEEYRSASVEVEGDDSNEAELVIDSAFSEKQADFVAAVSAQCAANKRICSNKGSFQSLVWLEISRVGALSLFEMVDLVGSVQHLYKPVAPIYHNTRPNK